MKKTEQRRHPREALSPPGVGIVYPESREKGGAQTGEAMPGTLLVNVLNRSPGGLLLESSRRIDVGCPVDVLLNLPGEEGWRLHRGNVLWTRENPLNPLHHLFGIKSRALVPKAEIPVPEGLRREKRMYPGDLEFLLQTPIFDSISQEAKCPFLNAMTPRGVIAGERIISQGEEGDAFFIIQEGSCVVRVEREGLQHEVARLKDGDIVGEMAILTGESRVAHVDAETDALLWCVSRMDFDDLCDKYPDLRNFLTKLITRRFSAGSLTAERTVAKYVINEMIGKGGWSIVYRGIHESLNMPVAVKMLKHDMAMNPRFLDRFRNEARTIARLNHENIVKVYDIEELYRTIFIIMEYFEGMPLDRILQNIQKLPVAVAVDMILQVCAGLSYAHDQGIIHQDIKPANIFVQPDNRVKIVDFGLASAPGTIDSGLTGTILYMSPEQVDGEPVDERSDIYSLGITAYEIITGKRPFAGKNIMETIQMRLNEDLPDPRTWVPDLPDEISRFLLKATRRDPASRYARISEVMAELGPLAGGMGLNHLARPVEKRKMMSLFLFYQDEHQLTLNRLVEEFGNEVKKIGAVLRAADFKDI